MKSNKLLKLLFISLFSITFFSGCNNSEEESNEWVDYVSLCKLDLNSGRSIIDATVKTYIDGDTTHFTVNDPAFDGSLLKARYLAIDTPESTGKVQPYGKAASNFTKKALSNAESIKLESDSSVWTPDNTGGRYLTWVWYKNAGEEDYRLLNLELLQNGYTAGKNYSNYSYYANYFSKAMRQAMRNNLRCLGNQKDPDYWYGGAVEISLKQLRLHPEEYATDDKSVRVRFEGTVSYNFQNKDGWCTTYITDYDEEDEMTYGMVCFSGSTFVDPFLDLGSRVSVCGCVTKSNYGYQVSDITFNYMEAFSNDTYVIEKYVCKKAFTDSKKGEVKVGDIFYTDAYNELSYIYQTLEYFDDVEYKGDIVYQEISSYDFYSSNKVNIIEVVDGVEKNVEYSKPDILQDTLVKMDNLLVTSVSTTTSDDSTSKGALTLTCKTSANYTVKIRTEVLFDANNQMVLASAYEGKTINVKGVMSYYQYSSSSYKDYQMKVLYARDITIVE